MIDTSTQAYKKTIHAWCMYDWAISVYSLVITSSIFPIYYAHVAVNTQGGDRIWFMGYQLSNSVLYSYSLTVVFLLTVLLAPLLTSYADYSGKRKLLMQLFSTVGSTCCAGLFFFTSDTTVLAIYLFVGAGVGYGVSVAFYNSFLPRITNADQYDAVSAKGFSYGYVGSVTLLVFNLVMILKPNVFFGISEGLASRISFLSVGVWWFGFAWYTFRHLPSDHARHAADSIPWYHSLQRLLQTFRQVVRNKQIRYFLLSFFLYNMAVQTVMYIATLFAEKEFHLPSSHLIATVLFLQLLAVFGAQSSVWVSRRWGNIATITLQIIVWIGICLGAFFIQTPLQFYLLAATVGLVMGGIQAMSRATYSKYIPPKAYNLASYYGLYELVYNSSIVLGTLSYGLAEQITGSARNSVLILGGYFLISLWFLYYSHKHSRSYA